MSGPRILFLADPEPDYVADGLFHGLRSVLGAAVVDWPKREPMYENVDPRRLYGRGFGCYGLLPDISIDREGVFDQEWDLVISAVMWRDWRYWGRAWREFGSRVRHAVVDGGDTPWIYPYGPTWWRPGRWAVPRVRARATYFKREWARITILVGGRRVHLEPIAIAYPAEKMTSILPLKTQDFATHIVDLEVGQRLGRPLAHDRQHLFDNESDYLSDLRASRFGVTTKRAGWDALRHLEIAGAGAVPCFRRLDDKPKMCAPHGLVDGENCLSYRDADDLMRRIDGVRDEEWERLAQGALDWAHVNTTEQRARCFLARAL